MMMKGASKFEDILLQMAPDIAKRASRGVV